MKSGGDVWSSPIGENDRLVFLDKARDFGAKMGVDPDSVNVEEVTLSFNVDWATTDFNSASATPFEKKILQAAAAAADAASVIRRTQDPILDGTSRLPGDMLIGIFGFGARYRASAAAATAATIAPNIAAIQQALDESVFVAQQGALRRFELAGDEFMSYGSGPHGQVAGTIETEVSIKDRGWRAIKPVILGKEQQLRLSHFVGRSTAWPAAFTVRYMMPSLIARVK